MKALPFLFCLLVVGCATSCHDSGFTGGFRDLQLVPDVFRITFRGNAYTSPERTQDFALLRASQLVLQNGFTGFAILDEKHSGTTWTYSTPATAQTTTRGTADTIGTLSGNNFQGNTYLSAQSTAAVDLLA